MKVFKKIGTHSGSFHCDEVMACSILKLLPQFKEAEIIRSRDNAVLETCDIVVDVGAVYNTENHRYDHHQREFNLTLGDCNKNYFDQEWAKRTKLSSAGLVYAHFGKDILRQITELNDEEYLEILYRV